MAATHTIHTEVEIMGQEFPCIADFKYQDDEAYLQSAIIDGETCPQFLLELLGEQLARLIEQDRIEQNEQKKLDVLLIMREAA